MSTVCSASDAFNYDVSSDYNVVLSQYYPYDLQDQDKASFEKTLNLLGYFPVFSTFTGPLRILVGLITIVTSSVKAPLCAIADLFQKTENGYFYRIGKHVSYIGHGLLNMIRGCIESIPVAGNITTLFYDFGIGRVSYPVESTGPHYIMIKK